MASKPPFTELQNYFHLIAEHMGLAQWMLVIDINEEPDEIEMMSVHVQDNRRRAQVRVNPEWTGWGKDECRYYVVHEFVHCHLGRISSLLVDCRAPMAHDVDRVLGEAHLREEEFTVDGIALAWSKSLPLPPFGS